MTSLVVIRAIHYAAMAQLAGGVAFAVLVVPAQLDNRELPSAFLQRFRRLIRGSAVLAVLSWLLWLVPAAAEMAGISISDTRGEVLMRVIVATEFGHVWLLRVVLLMLLLALLMSLPAPVLHARRRLASALIIAAITVASLSLSSHAAAQTGSAKLTAVVSDASHLVAASAWLGALLPFSIALLTTPSISARYVLARRFSRLGIVSVALIVASGVWNSSYLVGSWAALFGTDYGRSLLLKLALVACMLMLAVANRRMTPTLGVPDDNAIRAQRRIARNAVIEATLGAGVLVIAGVLADSMPGAHDQPQWPFSFRIEFDSGAPAIVRAYPTTYAHPAVPYTTAAIAQGLASYQRNCVSCHGAQARGDGPDAGTLPPRPANLTAEHVLAHPSGDVYWWITEGIQGTAMPGFAQTTDEKERWGLVHLVRTMATAHSLDDLVTTSRVRAPAFTYQVGDGVQATMPSRDGTSATLVVFFTLPDSSRRLSELAQGVAQLHNLVVLAFPLNGLPNGTTLNSPPNSILATASPDVSSTYRLLSDIPPGEAPHVEFLVDRDGWLRARWRAPGTLSIPDLANFVHTLPTVPAPEPMAMHGHHR